jgi:hypothetical protein
MKEGKREDERKKEGKRQDERERRDRDREREKVHLTTAFPRSPP